jgi:superoxide reductase
MCGDQKFFICKHCGNLVGLVQDGGVEMICCGEPMVELIPNTTDGAVEKHLPVVTIEKDFVTVAIGSIPHPMIEKHYISWVYLLTEKGGQRKCLAVGSEPVAKFAIVDDKVLSVFAYCNIHGLWKTNISE